MLALLDLMSTAMTYQVDTRDLLEHLVDIREDDSMEVSVLVHSEKILESSTLL